MSFEGNPCFYIDDFTCGHAWTSIEDFNNQFYIHLSQTNNNDINWSFIISIANGNYTGPDFALELQNNLRTATNSIQSNLFNVSYNSK